MILRGFLGSILSTREWSSWVGLDCVGWLSLEEWTDVDGPFPTGLSRSGRITGTASVSEGVSWIAATRTLWGFTMTSCCLELWSFVTDLELIRWREMGSPTLTRRTMGLTSRREGRLIRRGFEMELSSVLNPSSSFTRCNTIEGEECTIPWGEEWTSGTIKGSFWWEESRLEESGLEEDWTEGVEVCLEGEMGRLE